MTTRMAWTLLLLKPLAAFAVHGAWVAALALRGAAEPWWQGAAAWPVTQGIANLAMLAGFVWVARRAGVRWWPPIPDVTASRAALWALAPAAAVAGFAVVSAGWFFADAQHARFLLAGPPAPMWAVVIGPLAAAAVEFPLMAGHVLPRLRAAGVPAAVAAASALSALTLSSVAAPFVPAMAFFVWRAVAFLPLGAFALLLSARHPRALAFVAAGHAVGAAAFGVWAGRG